MKPFKVVVCKLKSCKYVNLEVVVFAQSIHGHIVEFPGRLMCSGCGHTPEAIHSSIQS